MAARKQEWTVRVINYEDGPGALRNHLRGVWVEQLRYMGFVKELANLENPPRTVLEFYAPKGIDSHVWAGQNAERMRSFGIDAAAAPKWDVDRYDRPRDPKDEPAHMERLNRPRIKV
jgi:hypothetical protein